MRNKGTLALVGAALIAAPLLLYSATVRHALPGGAEQDFTDYAANVNVTNNQAAHNTTLGALEVGNGGTAYFDDNAAIASHTIYVGASRLVRMIANGSTTAVITFYDDSDGTCSTTQRLPPITVPSVATTTTWEIGMDFSNAICMLVATAADAEISLVYLP